MQCRADLSYWKNRTLLSHSRSCAAVGLLQSSPLSWRWTRSWSVVGKVSHFDLWLLSIWQLMALQQYQIIRHDKGGAVQQHGRCGDASKIFPSQQVPPSPDGQKHFVSVSFVSFQDICFNLCCSSRWSRARKLQMIQCSENQMWQESFVVFLCCNKIFKIEKREKI